MPSKCLMSINIDSDFIYSTDFIYFFIKAQIFPLQNFFCAKHPAIYLFFAYLLCRVEREEVSSPVWPRPTGPVVQTLQVR